MFATLSAELADRMESDQLTAESRRAEHNTWMTLDDNGDGTWSGQVHHPRAAGPLAAPGAGAAVLPAAPLPRPRGQDPGRRDHRQRPEQPVLDRAPRPGVLRADRAPAHRRLHQRQRRHPRRPHRPRRPRHRRRRRHPGRRSPDQRRRDPPAGLRGQHPAARDERRLGPARPRPRPAAPHPPPADRALRDPRHLRRGRLRTPLRLVRDPPPPPRAGARTGGPTSTTASRCAATTTDEPTTTGGTSDNMPRATTASTDGVRPLTSSAPWRGQQRSRGDFGMVGRRMPPPEVWYVSYGSNMCRDRLRCYIEGGRPRGGALEYVGARDDTLPAR